MLFAAQRVFVTYVLLIAGSYLSAQVVPYGFGLEEGIKALIFVASDCPACKTLSNLENQPILFIGNEPNLDLDYVPYHYDYDLLFGYAFRVSEAPTVIILSNGFEVERWVGEGNPETIAAAITQASTEKLFLASHFNIKIGEHLEGQFANHTGLVVFYRESCELCQEAKGFLIELCKAGKSIYIISTRDEPLPEICPGEVNRQTAIDWGVQIVPTIIYLKAGQVIWIDQGYREAEELELFISALEL